MPLRSAPAPLPICLAAAALAAGCAGTTPAVRAEAPAEAEHRPSAPYPAASIQAREQGRVVVRVLTGPDGRPREAQLHQTSGFARLDRAALETVMQWRFRPTPGADAVWREVPFTFGIVGGGPVP